jgi:hypothetical protein
MAEESRTVLDHAVVRPDDAGVEGIADPGVGEYLTGLRVASVAPVDGGLEERVRETARLSDPLESQAFEDQVQVVKEMCSHVDRVITALSSRGPSDLPVEAHQAVEKLKGKMILFASGASIPVAGSRVRSSVTHESESSVAASSFEEVSNSESEADVRPKLFKGRPKVLPIQEEMSQVASLRATHGSLEERLILALERLDTRSVPAPEPYNRASGHSFRSFLFSFEEYCRHSFRGSDKAWVAELGRYLVGDMHGAFVAHRAPSDSYGDIKAKMLRWYEESKSRREAGSRAMFGQASKRGDESVRLYAARLENLFRLAYPKKQVDNSQTLQEKFLSSIPRRFRKQIKSSISLAKVVEGTKLKWTQIVKLVGGLEEAFTTDDSADDVQSSWSVMQSGVRSLYLTKTDAATQCQAGTSGIVSFSGSRGRSSSVPSLRSQRSPFYGRSVNFDERERSLAVTCHHCNKLGHVRRDCRRRLGLCLVCGSPDHRVARCPCRQFAGQGYPENRAERGRSMSPGMMNDRSARESRNQRVRFEAGSGEENTSRLNSYSPRWRESPRN